MSSASGRRGRPAKFVKGLDGKLVVGLSIDRYDKKYYTLDPLTKKKVRLGTDLAEAIRRLRLLQDDEELAAIPMGSMPKRLRMPDWLEPPPETMTARLNAGLSPLEERQVGTFTLVPAAGFWKAVADEIRRDPVNAAERTGIPELARLAALPAAEPPLSLKRVGELYFGKRKKLSADWHKKQRGYWAEFRKAIGVNSVRDVTPDVIRRYHDDLWTKHERSKKSATWLSHRLQAVKTIVRNAIKAGQGVDDLRRVLDAMECFELPRKTPVNPKPISPADFSKLLAVADTEMRVMLLLALNAILYGKEVAGVRKADIDLDAGAFISTRQKTGVARVCVLWERTTEALRNYLAENANGRDELFINREGAPYADQTIRHRFAKLREEAGLASSVTFSMIRDGGYSAAANAGVPLDAVRALAGQRLGGVTDAYLRRTPQFVVAACKAIESHYFGGRGSAMRSRGEAVQGNRKTNPRATSEVKTPPVEETRRSTRRRTRRSGKPQVVEPLSADDAGPLHDSR